MYFRRWFDDKIPSRRPYFTASPRPMVSVCTFVGPRCGVSEVPSSHVLEVISRPALSPLHPSGASLFSNNFRPNTDFRTLPIFSCLRRESRHGCSNAKAVLESVEVHSRRDALWLTLPYAFGLCARRSFGDASVAEKISIQFDFHRVWATAG